MQHELCREDMLNGGLKGPESARVHLLNDLDNEGDQAPHAAKETAATSTSIAVDNSCTINVTRAVAREERFAVCSTTCSTTWFARTRYKGKKKASPERVRVVTSGATRRCPQPHNCHPKADQPFHGAPALRRHANPHERKAAVRTQGSSNPRRQANDVRNATNLRS